MATYRIQVNQMEAAANGDVVFDCVIQKLWTEDPETWVMVDKGHRSLVLPSAALLAIRDGPGTEAEKRAAVKAIFLQKAREWGLDESDEAAEFVYGLVPVESWPIEVPWSI